MACDGDERRCEVEIEQEELRAAARVDRAFEQTVALLQFVFESALPEVHYELIPSARSRRASVPRNAREKGKYIYAYAAIESIYEDLYEMAWSCQSAEDLLAARIPVRVRVATLFGGDDFEITSEAAGRHVIAVLSRVGVEAKRVSHGRIDVIVIDPPEPAQRMDA